MDEGGRLIGKDVQPTQVTLRPNHTTLTAHLTFADSDARVIIKEVPDRACRALADGICQVQDQICRQSQLLSQSTPAFYGYHQSTSCLAMEYIPGTTLLDVLRLELHGRRPKGYDCEQLIDQSSEVLAEFHRVAPATVGVAEATRSNGSYVEALGRLIAEPSMHSALRPVNGCLQRAISGLGRSFCSRTDSRLLVHDAQPKNILVPGPDRVCFIDLAFSGGPPAMNLALFVTMFDRLAARYISGKAKAAIHQWKQAFVTHYFRHTDFSETANDFHFYHLWALVMTMRRHMNGTKWLRPYLSRYYSRRIKSVLENDTRSLTGNAAVLA
jgi:hypothetical protein